MRNPDLLLYMVHVAFWASFGMTRRSLHRKPHSDPGSVATSQEYTAPFSRTVLAFHMLGFGVLYFGIGNAVIPRRVPTWFAGQRIVGTLVIALGAALMSWALLSFHSWRFRAKLDEGHQLATNGAFRLMRHPIYTGLTLLALGSAIWAPTAIIWSGFALIAIGSELRARSEEVVLKQAFGDAYVEYAKRTRRFVPFVY
ncbi:MAG TPA: isoprenylcysteine carboxylmethyltransferase family protein [Thermoanaerobaculia bacterium]|nr:isoprenylcysteine carboxylmethyltransferase family protein [Thermoanaerobaculia bacterium]